MLLWLLYGTVYAKSYFLMLSGFAADSTSVALTTLRRFCYSSTSFLYGTLDLCPLGRLSIRYI